MSGTSDRTLCTFSFLDFTSTLSSQLLLRTNKLHVLRWLGHMFVSRHHIRHADREQTTAWPLITIPFVFGWLALHIIVLLIVFLSFHFICRRYETQMSAAGLGEEG
ncbi:hypothetical protein LY78DRAFT_123182 [Colletotrichum sublineola]|nr:hypothetical protein LY78DRAFT_123182 [Colletotrichum sublineola]